MNYVRCCRLAEFNSTVTLILSLQLGDLVCACYSVNCLRMSLYKYFKRVDISASLPDPKGPLSDQIPTASIAEANKEVLKAVAEVKEPEKKGPYIIVTPEYKAKIAKFASINGNSVAARKYTKLWGRS